MLDYIVMQMEELTVKRVQKDISDRENAVTGIWGSCTLLVIGSWAVLWQCRRRI